MRILKNFEHIFHRYMYYLVVIYWFALNIIWPAIIFRNVWHIIFMKNIMDRQNIYFPLYLRLLLLKKRIFNNDIFILMFQFQLLNLLLNKKNIINYLLLKFFILKLFILILSIKFIEIMQYSLVFFNRVNNLSKNYIN